MTKHLARASVLIAALFLASCGTFTNWLYPSAASTEQVQQPQTVVATGSSTASDAATTGTAATTAGSSTEAQVVFDARAGYDAVFLVPASKYASLPRCGTSGASPAPLCSDPKIVVMLQNADKAAKAALDAAEDLARNHPGLSIDAAMAAAKNSIAAAETILSTYNIH